MEGAGALSSDTSALTVNASDAARAVPAPMMPAAIRALPASTAIATAIGLTALLGIESLLVVVICAGVMSRRGRRA
jgi:hypothetical protein